VTWLLYGAYGYTGRLVAELAAARGERPVLAGRRSEPLAEVASRLGLPYRVVGLDDHTALVQALDGIDVVAHCAGPYSATSAPMVAACLQVGAHYLDVTGEIDVLEAVLARGEEAAANAVVLLPGAGFDVVPSDCLAATVAAAVDRPVRLELALRMGGGVSPGTAATGVEALGEPARCRTGGMIGPVPDDRRRRRVPFADGPAEAVAIPWGDVATAWWSTGAPDITVYLAVPDRLAGALSTVGGGAGPLASLLRRPELKRVLGGAVRRLPGPSDRARSRSRGQLWAEATGADGRRASATMTTPNAYALTADSVVRVVQALSAGSVAPGAWTPSKALGADFARTLDGVTLGEVMVVTP
jgi:short subunit dehydrogenase-like uncharacterized protein